MSQKMELAELAQKFRNNASAVLSGDQVADEILNWAADFTIVRAASPAQEPVTTEPVRRSSSHPYGEGECAPPQPGREWLPISGMEWPAMPVMLGFWYQGAFKQYIAEHDPAGWMEQGKRTFYPSHMQGWFTHWQPLSAPPAGEPE